MEERDSACVADFAVFCEELLPTLLLLMDVDSIEGKLPRRDERDSDETDKMTIVNVRWGHGGLVTGHEKCFPGVVPL